MNFHIYLKSSNNFYLISILFILIPFLEFLTQNLDLSGIYLIKELSKILILSLFIIFFLSLVLSVVLRKNLSLKKFFLYFSIFFYCSFSFMEIYEFLLKFKFLYEQIYYFSAIILLIFSFIIFFTSLNNLIRNVYLVIILFYLIFLTSLYFLNSQKHSELYNNNSEYIIANEAKNINMFYILLDGMMSLELFSKYYDHNINHIKKDLSEQNIKYIENTKSNYISTQQVFTSIFNLENLDIKKLDEQGIYIFPKNTFNGFQDAPLIRNLKKNEIQFFWEGNSVMSCIFFADEYCIDDKNYYYFNTYIIGSFLSNNLIRAILHKGNIKIYNNLSKNSCNINDAICNFIKKSSLLDMYEKNFIFIHHLNPHDPHIFDENCNPIKKNGDYYQSYLCTINKIINLIDHINTLSDHNIVLFQGDHGWPYNGLEKTKDIFTAIYTNTECKLEIKNNFDNVEAIKYMFDCYSKL